MKALLFILAVTLSFVCTATPQVIVTQQGQEFRGSISAKWKWVLLEEKVRSLILEVTFQASELSGFDRVVTKSKRLRPKLKGNELRVFMDGFTEKVLLAGNGGKLLLDFKAILDEQKQIQSDNCSSLTVRPSVKRFPFYVGVSCTETNDITSLTLTFPHEVSLDNSSVFETKGKGEPWRQFELGNIKQAAGQIAKFTFMYAGRNYDFSVEAEAPQAAKTEDAPDRMTFAGAAGFAIVGISGSDLSASDGKPTIVLRVPHYPFIGGLGGGLSADIALPLSKSINSMSFFQMDIFAAYEFVAGIFKIRPQVGYVIYAQTHDDTQIGLNITDLGVGLGLDTDLGGNFHLLFRGMKCGLASSVYSGHYDLELMGYYKKKGSTGYGLGGKIQSFQATSELGIDRKFNTMLFYALAAF